MMDDPMREREALHRAIHECTLCKDRLGYDVRSAQPPWDPSRAHALPRKWGMLIGQSPGRQEWLRGREVTEARGARPSRRSPQDRSIAFAGDAGRRLRQWLEEAGFSDQQIRTRFHKTALTKCYPGKNERGGDRAPTKREIELCSPFLKEQIRLAEPSVIVPMGRVAITWFFPDVEDLAEVIGKARAWPNDEAPFTVVCLPHSSRASTWWKREDNKPLLESAKRLLSKLRVESCP